MKNEKIQISGHHIKLDQFLKLTGDASTGGEAKIRIAQGEIKVNKVVESHRGKKLRHGDIIEVQDKVYEIEGARQLPEG